MNKHSTYAGISLFVAGFIFGFFIFGIIFNNDAPIPEPMHESPFEGVSVIEDTSDKHVFEWVNKPLEQRVSALEDKVEELMAPDDIEYEIRGKRLWYRLSDGEWREYEPHDYESTAFALE